MRDKLHVIIPFFNILNSKNRIRNLEKCIQHLKFCDNIVVYIVEGYINEPNFENNFIFNNENIIYLKYQMPSTLWIKENLINLAISKLPSDWKYVAWIDSDVIFLNFDFANHTINKLQNNDVVQLFRSVSFLDQNGDMYVETDGKMKYMILFSYILSKKKYDKYGHPGFAWAITKNFYEKIGGLFEYNIVGCGDLLFADCCINKIFEYQSPSLGYEQCLNNYLNNFKNIKYDYVQGHISHLYHGFFKSRKYEDRWDILIKHKFDPTKDLIKENGILKINNINLEKDIFDFFDYRKS